MNGGVDSSSSNLGFDYFVDLKNNFYATIGTK
jgi:hypothetical protein